MGGLRSRATCDHEPSSACDNIYPSPPSTARESCCHTFRDDPGMGTAYGTIISRPRTVPAGSKCGRPQALGSVRKALKNYTWTSAGVKALADEDSRKVLVFPKEGQTVTHAQKIQLQKDEVFDTAVKRGLIKPLFIVQEQLAEVAQPLAKKEESIRAEIKAAQQKARNA